MARAGVTYHDVAKAADQLNQQGKMPTVDGVREVLGTGSKSTIAPLLKEWKAKQAGGVDAQQTGLPSELLASVKGLYEGMQHQADERIETIQSQAKQEIDEAKREALAAQKSNAGLQSDLIKHQASIEQLEQGKQLLQSDLSKVEQAYTTEKTQHEALQYRLNDRDQENSRLNSQLDQAQRNLDHYRDTVQKQRDQERADFERQLVSLEQTLKQEQQENQSIRHNLGRVENELTKAETARDHLQGANKTLTDLNDQQNKEALQAQQSLADLNVSIELAQQSNQTSKEKSKTLEEQVMQLEKQTAVAQDKIKVLTVSNEKAEGRIESLRGDITILKQEKANIEGQFKQMQRSL